MFVDLGPNCLLEKPFMQHSLSTNREGRRRVFWTWFLNAVVFIGLALLIANMDWLRVRLRVYQDTSLLRSVWLALGSAMALLLLARVVHELGHLLSAPILGMRVRQISIGPLRFVRQGGRWHLGRVPDHLIPNGYALTTPLSVHRHKLRQLMMWFVLAGPIASFIWMVVCGGLFWVFRYDRPLWLQAAWLPESLLISAVFSLYLLISSLLPNTIPGNQPSDGMRWQLLRNGGPAADRWTATVCLLGANAHGIRPKQWDPTLMRQALAQQDNTLDGLQAKMLGYLWALDSGRERLAMRFLDEVMDSHQMWRLGGRERFGVEKAFILARQSDDGRSAREWLMRVTHLPTDHPQYLRADAAVLLKEGRLNSAERQAKAALTQLQKGRTGVAQAETAWVAEIIEAITKN